MRICLLFLFVTPIFGADPAPKAVTISQGKPITVEVGKKCILTIETTAKKVTWRAPLGPDTLAIDGKRLAVWATEGVYKFIAQVPSGDDVLSTEVILTVTGPRPPPGPPPDPGPAPPVPPQPVTSFRVIFSFESASTLTAVQNSVIYGKQVADYLNSHCTRESGHPDWRRYDQNVNTANELPNMKALWEAAKAKMTGVPCWVIERNGKADILPLPTSVADALKTLQSYGGQ